MSIQEQLIETPYTFDFFEALRQLECEHGEKDRIGKSQQPKNEFIRLGQIVSAVFAPSTIASVQQDNNKLRMQVYFFGMFGPNGPLPLHLTEYAQDRMRDAKDDSLGQFMDMFHHRLLSLFYRAWANKEPTVQYDRPHTDRFRLYTGSLLGLGMPTLQKRDAMPDNSKMHYAGHMSAHTRHAEGLASVLQSFFSVPVSLHEFIGEWLEIPEQSICLLGMNNEGASLGESTVLGGRSWQRQFKFRIVVGPMTLEEYEGLLPGKNKLQLVRSIIKNYLGYELNWELNLLLKKEEIPKTTIGGYGQLGWTSWLHNQAPINDSAEFMTA